eukprot:CAMPEP_0181311232 /NCGR_PEP_ID=MMETSP1101-20121128/13023_1 /TAXON_ID=46948 /ORGANISM="Rhodomonas abbreviata, Strain Caron Lab Isolate" /LENGTH=111 /DNA_ID=CAMNT_0023417941 /DNA_START=188 /DNA_END=523 /DNA_ORIENTATION=-
MASPNFESIHPKNVLRNAHPTAQAQEVFKPRRNPALATPPGRGSEAERKTHTERGHYHCPPSPSSLSPAPSTRRTSRPRAGGRGARVLLTIGSHSVKRAAPSGAPKRFITP